MEYFPPIKQEVKHIKTNKELIVGRSYWLRFKYDSSSSFILQCMERDKMKYFDDHIWAEDHNNQALQRYDIIGPVPEISEQTFTKMILNDLILNF